MPYSVQGNGDCGRIGRVEFSGIGDPARSLNLLWNGGRQPRRGPRPRLTVDRIVHTAIRIADAHGLAGLSIRRVAQELRVAPMSLYTYLPGKGELIDLMVDTALGEPAEPAMPEPAVPQLAVAEPALNQPGGGWRAGLARIAREHWALYHRHPWLLQVSTHRPVLGPNLIARYDRELRAVDGIGLTDLEMDSVLTLLTGYVRSAAHASVAAAEVERRTGITDHQWWQDRAPLLAAVLDPDQFPVAARVGAAAGAAYQSATAPAREFEFGLERILDGVEVLVRARHRDDTPG